MPQRLLTPSINAPGWRGLNTELAGTILSTDWAVSATNLIVDTGGRLAARKGNQRVNTGTGGGLIGIAGTEDVTVIHEYIDSTGASLRIFAIADKIYKDNGDGTVTDITGTITLPSAGNWKFQNFNGVCVGFQQDHAPIVLTSVGGTFANITLSGTQQPTQSANDVLAAFGRLWTIDGTLLKYSDALNYAAWNGVFDLKTVWLNGMDIGTAVAEFNGYLVVFGQRSIVIYSNPWDPSGGGSLDTTQMLLIENLFGVGCIARDSVQGIGTDLIFLSSSGLRSLSRVIQEKSVPITDLSRNVRDHFMGLVRQETANKIRSVYSRSENCYLITLPTKSKVFYFDTRQPLDDGALRATEWDIKLTALYEGTSSILYMGRPGYLVTYTGYKDDVTSGGTGGSTYRIKYKSGWTYFDDQVASRIKIPKRASLVILGGNNVTHTLLWAFDYDTTEHSANVLISLGNIAEYNVAEYNIAEYSGGTYVNEIKSQLDHNGTVMAFGLQADVNGEVIGIQKVDLQIKLGREGL